MFKINGEHRTSRFITTLGIAFLGLYCSATLLLFLKVEAVDVHQLSVFTSLISSLAFFLIVCLAAYAQHVRENRWDTALDALAMEIAASVKPERDGALLYKSMEQIKDSIVKSSESIASTFRRELNRMELKTAFTELKETIIFNRESASRHAEANATRLDNVSKTLSELDLKAPLMGLTTRFEQFLMQSSTLEAALDDGWADLYNRLEQSEANYQNRILQMIESLERGNAGTNERFGQLGDLLQRHHRDYLEAISQALSRYDTIKKAIEYNPNYRLINEAKDLIASELDSIKKAIEYNPNYELINGAKETIAAELESLKKAVQNNNLQHQLLELLAKYNDFSDLFLSQSAELAAKLSEVAHATETVGAQAENIHQAVSREGNRTNELLDQSVRQTIAYSETFSQSTETLADKLHALEETAQNLAAAVKDLHPSKTTEPFLASYSDTTTKFIGRVEKMLSRLDEHLLEAANRLKQMAQTLSVYVEKGGVADVALLHKTMNGFQAAGQQLVHGFQDLDETLNNFEKNTKALIHLPEVVVELKRAGKAVEMGGVKSEKSATQFGKTASIFEKSTGDLARNVEENKKINDSIASLLTHTDKEISNLGKVIPSISDSLVGIYQALQSIAPRR